MSLKLINSEQVRQSISMKEAISTMESAFLQLITGRVQLPLRTPIEISKQNALNLTMPAYLEQDDALGLKVVSVFPNNSAKKLPTINGLIILLDAQTGMPKALMEAGYLTTLRTGAVSGLASLYFSHENSSHLAIIGSGSQAMMQLEAVSAVRPINQISIWSRNKDNAKEFAIKITGNYEVRCCDTVSQAVKDADIICTATSSSEPLIDLQDLQPHAHINAIGSHNRHMREISNDVLDKAIVIVDQLEAALAEAGEIIAAIDAHQLNKKSIIEIGEWLTHKNVDYTQCLTLFKSVGLAIQDISVAERVYQNAINQGLDLREF
ncbi:MAG: ornithine cyclodeaminase family protein [Legionella sp.]|jgi:ornithine cyclodeaminase